MVDERGKQMELITSDGWIKLILCMALIYYLCLSRTLLASPDQYMWLVISLLDLLVA